MVRIATTFWFVVLTLLGPQACCCTFNRLLAAKTEPVQAQHHDATKHPCCHGHHSAAKTKAKAPVHKHEPDQCPCKKGSDKQRALPTPVKSFDDGSILQILDGWYAQSLPAFPHAADSHGVRKVCEIDAETPPFLSTEDILHLLHMLRC